MTAELLQKIKELETQLDNVQNMSVAQRAVCCIQRTCTAHGLKHTDFVLPISKTLLATRIGTPLETLSRALPHIKALGVTVQGRNVKINAPVALKTVCNDCFGTDTCKAFKAIHGNPYKE